MHPRAPRIGLSAVGLIAVSIPSLLATPAMGAPGDAEALGLRKGAIYSDYLGTDFAAAESKLAQAIAVCGRQPCEPAVRARLQCDLGAVLFADGKPGDAKAHFALALHEDPSIEIDSDLSSSDLQRVFAESRNAGPGAAPSASAAARPDQAADVPADCPPGLPGCHREATETACGSDDECPSQRCDGGICERGARAAPVKEAPFDRNWLSVAFQADLLLVPAANDACKGGTGYTCFDSGGAYYPGIPLAGADDVVSGGLALGTMRALLGYDRALGENLLVGTRLGYAFNGGPQRPTARAFLPVSGEVRVSYWFGHRPLGRGGLRFYILAGAGAEEVDASVPVDTYASVSSYEAKQSQNFNAWKKTGLGFGELGPGVMYALTPSTGILVEAKAVLMFPTAGAGGAVQLGYAIGL